MTTKTTNRSLFVGAVLAGALVAWSFMADSPATLIGLVIAALTGLFGVLVKRLRRSFSRQNRN